jgi:hypothetical protein
VRPRRPRGSAARRRRTPTTPAMSSTAKTQGCGEHAVAVGGAGELVESDLAITAVCGGGSTMGAVHPFRSSGPHRRDPDTATPSERWRSCAPRRPRRAGRSPRSASPDLRCRRGGRCRDRCADGPRPGERWIIDLDRARRGRARDWSTGTGALADHARGETRSVTPARGWRSRTRYTTFRPTPSSRRRRTQPHAGRAGAGRETRRALRAHAVRAIEPVPVARAPRRRGSSATNTRSRCERVPARRAVRDGRTLGSPTTRR